LILACLSFSLFLFSIAALGFLKNISIGPFFPPIFLPLPVEISISSSLSLSSLAVGLMEDVAVFSLNNFQSSSLTFCGGLVQGATFPFFVIKCSWALITPRFITFPQQLHIVVFRLDSSIG